MWDSLQTLWKEWDELPDGSLCLGHRFPTYWEAGALACTEGQRKHKWSPPPLHKSCRCMLRARGGVASSFLTQLSSDGLGLATWSWGKSWRKWSSSFLEWSVSEVSSNPSESCSNPGVGFQDSLAVNLAAVMARRGSKMQSCSPQLMPGEAAGSAYRRA